MYTREGRKIIPKFSVEKDIYFYVLLSSNLIQTSSSSSPVLAASPTAEPQWMSPVNVRSVYIYLSSSVSITTILHAFNIYLIPFNTL